MEEWFYQMGNPRKIKNLLTYLLKFAKNSDNIRHYNSNTKCYFQMNVK